MMVAILYYVTYFVVDVQLSVICSSVVLHITIYLPVVNDREHRLKLKIEIFYCALQKN